MELFQLQYFLVVAKEENLTHASRILNISQPALSMAITKLEQELGTSLFDRERGKIRLNPIGRQFCGEIDDIMHALNEAKNSIQEKQTSLLTPVRLATSVPELCGDLFPPLCQALPNGVFSAMLRDEGIISVDLERGNLDFAITKRIPGEQFVWVPLLREKYCLFLREDHPLSATDSIHIGSLSSQDLIAYVSSGGDMDFMPQALPVLGTRPRVRLDSNEPFTVLRLVEEGFGITIMPELFGYQYFSNHRYSRVRMLNIDGADTAIDIGLITLAGATLSRAAKQAYEIASDYLTALSKSL